MRRVELRGSRRSTPRLEQRSASAPWRRGRATPAAGRRAARQRGEHVGVGEHGGRDPRHLAGVGVGDDREPVERRCARARRPTTAERRRVVAAPARRAPAAAPAGVDARRPPPRAPAASATARSRRSARRAPRPAGRTACGTRGSRTAAAPRRRRSAPIGERRRARRSMRRVAPQHHHLGVLAHPRLVLGQRGSRELRRLLVDVVEDAVEPAVGRDQLGRRLLADARARRAGCRSGRRAAPRTAGTAPA